MRRIVAITLIIIIVFLVAYGLFDPFTDVVNGFALNVLGPAGFAMLSATYLAIVAAIGIPGLWAIGIIIGVFFGIVIKTLWYRGKWSIRKWGIKGAVQDIGAAGVTSIPATPAVATARPETPTEPVTTIIEEPKAEETQQT